MKTSILFFVFLFIFRSFSLTAQIANDMLDINNFHVPMNADGMIGVVGDTPFSDVPAGSGMSVFTVSDFWMAAKDRTYGDVHGFMPTFTFGPGRLNPGPAFFSTLSATDSVVTTAKYNRVWKVSKAEIDYHKTNYYKSEYIMPEAILNWPGNGDTTFGEAKILAPFTDYNGNEIYEPQLGDHPNIKGDQAVFAICTDNNSSNTDELLTKLGAELHIMIYGYAEPSNSLLGNTVFINYSVYNRSPWYDYDSLYAGFFADLDIGYFSNDYVGSDSALDLFYQYNGNRFDGYSPEGYMYDPAIGYVSLNNPLVSFMDCAKSFTVSDWPHTIYDAFYYMQAIFSDGVHLTSGGMGYFGTEKCNFFFPADPLDTTGWNEINEGSSPADRRGLGSAGPFAFNRGSHLCFEGALIFANDPLQTDITSSVYLLKSYAAQLKGMYPFLEEEQCVSYKTAVLPPVEDTALYDFKIYPVPANENIFIQTNLLAQEVLFAELYDGVGKLLNIYSFINDSDNDIHTIQTGDLPAGFYVIRINYNGFEFSEKVLIH